MKKLIGLFLILFSSGVMAQYPAQVGLDNIIWKNNAGTGVTQLAWRDSAFSQSITIAGYDSLGFVVSADATDSAQVYFRFQFGFGGVWSAAPISDSLVSKAVASGTVKYIRPYLAAGAPAPPAASGLLIQMRIVATAHGAGISSTATLQNFMQNCRFYYRRR